MSQKAAIQFFRGKHTVLSFIAPKISLGQLAMKLSFFELYIEKTSVFAFSWLKHVALSFIAQKKCFGLFAVKLCVCCSDIAPEKGFLSVCSGSAYFFLGFTQNNVFVSFRLCYAVFNNMFLGTGFSFLCYQNCSFDLLSYPNHLLVWLQLNQKLRALCHKKQRFSFFARKHAVLSFIQTENMFWLVDNEIGLL